MSRGGTLTFHAIFPVKRAGTYTQHVFLFLVLGLYFHKLLLRHEYLEG